MPDCSGDDAFGVYLRGVFLVCGLVANPEKAISLSCSCTMRANAEHCFP